MNENAADNSAPPTPERQSLPVLPHSGKVDRLREPAAPADSSNHDIQPMLNPPRPMHETSADLTPAQKATESSIVEVLRTIFDPEIPVNIYELGLIYRIDFDADNSVKITMTLTSPGCPVAGSLPGEVERRVESIAEVKSADVVLVWDPPWDKSRLSEAALLDLGML